jgi:taurine-pyruvate aminotransferase
MMDLHVNDLSDVVEADRSHVWHHLMPHKALETTDPRIIVEGRGMRVWDQHGKEHLDAVAGGVWTVNVGYGRTEIADAVRDQLVKMNYFAQTLGSVPGARFAERLTEKTPGLTRVFYANSGSEANEQAFKMIRAIAHTRHGGRKWKILYRDRDYHGTTLGCMSAGGQDERNERYGPFAPGFVRVPHCLEYRNREQGLGHLTGEDYGRAAADAVEEVILREGPDTVGAICLEAVTAGGGVIVAPPGYWERLAEIVAKYDLLVHMDEVVCGVGRTGTWFGYQHYPIRPDIVTMAKGLASGYAAISCVVTTEDVFDAFKSDPDDPLNFFRAVSTFGGCAAGPVAALENMAIIEREGLIENTASMGERLRGNLEALAERHPVIGQVRGLGLFCGAELVSDREDRTPAPEAQVKAVVADCMAQGVVIGASNRSIPGFNNTLLFSPALIAGPSEIDAITEAVDGALTRVFG